MIASPFGKGGLRGISALSLRNKINQCFCALPQSPDRGLRRESAPNLVFRCSSLRRDCSKAFKKRYDGLSIIL